ncbi:MAG: hypothetical protein J6L72_02290 [Butyricicoccus sp.]|nr:hypothetical protein [Butyricicoccus sp.]
MFYNNGYQQPMYGYQQPQQQMYQQSRMDFLQSMQPQQGGLQARPVTGREEAVAATVFPGSPVLFLDRAHGAVYYKAVDPNTNAVEFVDFAVAQPVQQTVPQYATLADIEAIRGEMAQIRDMIPTQTRRAKGADAE